MPRRHTSVNTARVHLFAIAMARLCARDEEDEAARFRDGDGDATSVHGDGREAARAREHVDNANSVRAGKVVAAPTSLFAIIMPCASDDEDEATRFHDRDVGATNARGDGREAVRAHERDGYLGSVRKNDVRAGPASMFAVARTCPCDGKDEAVRFHDREGSATSAHRDDH